MANKPRVLCVDDEPAILEGLSLVLRRNYKVTTASGGQQALEVMAQQEQPFSVILSDMRMPNMDGATFLGKAKESSPLSTRMLLTGYTDIESAIQAINGGQIFRFLTKPCPRDSLLESFQAAVNQFELLQSEKVLLEETLTGAISALSDVLAATNPMAFGYANRIKRCALKLANAMQLQKTWQIGVAAVLSQIGHMSLPPETQEKIYHGQELTPHEEELVDGLPDLALRILGHIPRLEEVLKIIQNLNTNFDTIKVKTLLPMESCILRVARDYTMLMSQDISNSDALSVLQSRSGFYDPTVLNALAGIQRPEPKAKSSLLEIPIAKLCPGLLFAEDVTTTKGLLIMARGNEATPAVVARLQNFPPGLVKEPIRVIRRVARALEQA